MTAEQSELSPELQTAASVLMVRPATFGFNVETAATNVFAREPSDGDIVKRVLAEFDGVSARLAEVGVEVLVLCDLPSPAKPDAIFPNNWVTLHADGTLATYPMAAPSRRFERQPERLRGLLESRGFHVRRMVDLSEHERHGRFLEGTGSLILDRPNRRAFAAIGPRTDLAALADFEAQMGYHTVCFSAADETGRPVYHTNVLLSLGTRFAMLCLDAVVPDQRTALVERIESSGRTLIRADFAQLRCFACNILELRGQSGEPVIALSTGALRSLRPDQRRALESFGQLIDADIPTIEAVGGGGVRCMIADIHLPRGPSPNS